MSFLNELNENQRRAATATEGPVLLLAGAGSGKTRTLTYRLRYLIEQKQVSPESILAVSFTNKAAAEMRERAVKLLKPRPKTMPMLCTFHSFGVNFLRAEADKIGLSKQFSISDQSDQLALVRQILRKYKDNKSFDVKTILTKISFLKNKGIRASDFVGSHYFDYEDPYDLAIEHVYSQYEQKLSFFQSIDFDDILLKTVEVLQKNPDVREKYSRKYQYIMIDEFQDTNPLQMQLVLYLTCLHNNICVVGDDDQSIYSFRGAIVENILKFHRQFEGTQVIHLHANYRSNGPIIELANNVIEKNKKRHEKKMSVIHQGGERPRLWGCADEDHEAAVIVEDIVMRRKQGASLKEMAILYRSQTQISPIEDQLRLQNIPYVLIGGQKLYEKKEVKDLMAYLTAIEWPHHEVCLRRILNVPARGIGEKTLERYLNHAKADNCSLFVAIAKHSVSDTQRGPALGAFTAMLSEFKRKFKEQDLAKTIRELMEALKFKEYIEKSYDSPKQVAKRQQDLEVFIESAARFKKFYPDASLKDFIEKLLLQDQQDTEKNEEEEEVVKLNMMSLHGSKGLEFDTVYLIGIEEELLPHKRCINEDRDIEEERRLFYVGITRARKDLIMSRCFERQLFGKKLTRHPSRFLDKMQDLYLEQNRVLLGHLNEREAKEYKKNFFEGLMDSL